jgi:hypothetical protein
VLQSSAETVLLGLTVIWSFYGQRKQKSEERSSETEERETQACASDLPEKSVTTRQGRV